MVGKEGESGTEVVNSQGGEPWLEDVPAVRLVGKAKVKNYFGTSAEVCNYSNWVPEQRAWHQDGTADTRPFQPRFGLLRAIKVPAHGGDTLFASTRHIARRLLERE